MDHVAYMKKSWALLPKILRGEKQIESRWYKNKHLPWGKILKGDTVYFKDTGKPVSISAEVSQVMSFDKLTPKKVKELLDRYGRRDGIDFSSHEYFYDLFKNKKFCLLIFLKNAKSIQPFEINKKGYGAMSAWITVNNIDTIRMQTPGDSKAVMRRSVKPI